jgi:hypothetical protein
MAGLPGTCSGRRSPMPSSAAAKVKEEPKLDDRRLDSYAGEYRVMGGPTAGEILTIERDSQGPLLRSKTSPAGVRLHPQDEHTFFITEVEMQFTFEGDGLQAARRFLIRFAGTDTPAERIEPR